MFHITLALLRFVVVMWVATTAARSQPDNPSADAASLIDRAGNTDEETERQAALARLATLPIDTALREEARFLAEFVARWNDREEHLHFYSRARTKRGDGLPEFPFPVAPDSPLRPITELYRGRMLAWELIESSTIRVVNPTLRTLYKSEAVRSFEVVLAAFPRNQIAAAYLGRPMSWPKQFIDAPNAPLWAKLQREHIERYRDVIHWWIDHRQRANGEFGGGRGDDCEAWRWWAGVLVAFEDPKIISSQLQVAKAALAQPEMQAGYVNKVSDVEHTAEDSTDSIIPLMLLEPNGSLWEKAARKLPRLMANVWTGRNKADRLQFRSYHFSASEVSAKPEYAFDVIGNVVALNPMFFLWQKTRDPELGKLLTAWLDTWVDATARAENGKPAGILPAAIRWPDGYVTGAGGDWWAPVPQGEPMAMYYVWPSVLTEFTDTLLVAHAMTKNEKYLAPIRSMAAIRLKYLKGPPESSLRPGTEAWAAAELGPQANSHNNYGSLVKTLARCRALMGTKEFDELLRLEGTDFAASAGINDPTAIEKAFQESLKFLGVNFPFFTSEVRYTDRIQGRYVNFLAGDPPPGTYEDYVGVSLPRYELMYRMVTGDGNYVRFPMPAVRWRTLPQDIAIWVKDATRKYLEVDLFHFGSTPRPITAQLCLLAPGEYDVELLDANRRPTGVTLASIHLDDSLGSIAFQLPPQQLRVLRISARATRR